MTLENKNLLIKDICGRLPYGLWVMDEESNIIHISYDDVHFENFFIGMLNGNIKPFLRPMSSMTEDEQKEFVKFHCTNMHPIIMDKSLTVENESSMIDWLNKNMFDHHDLIPKDLALVSHEEMYT